MTTKMLKCHGSCGRETKHRSQLYKHTDELDEKVTVKRYSFRCTRCWAHRDVEIERVKS